MSIFESFRSFKTIFLERERQKSIAFLFVLLALGAAAGAIYTAPRFFQPASLLIPPTPTPAASLTPTLEASSPSTTTVVYGFWRGGNSEIRAVNIDGTNDSAIAILPNNIKDVHAISKDQLLYIADTNQRDHGTKVEIYNLTDDTISTLVEADPGWGIDDIIVSPDKTLVAVWVVKFAPGKDILLGGNSKVYTKEIFGFSAKNLVINEVALQTSPIHYPLFFDGQNRLYVDSFIPNGGGWNLGLLRVDGSNLIPVLNDGEFSSDPLVSPFAGKTIAFTGYDPDASPQRTGNPSGIGRPAILNPNLLQTLDLNTLQKTTLLPQVRPDTSGAQYGLPVWSDNGRKIAFLEYKLTSPTSSTFKGTKIFDLSTNSVSSVPNLADNQTYLLSLKDEKLIWGAISFETSEPGNLGESYNPLLSSLSAVDPVTSEKKVLASGLTLQFIDAVSKNPGEPLGMTISPKAAQQEKSPTLQLGSLQLKFIAELRGNQQNNDGTLTCAEYLKLGEKEREMATQLGLITARKCYDSPLYLYPQKDTWVEVKVKPPVEIVDASPRYEKRWQVLANSNGKLTTGDGQTFGKINYAYLGPFFSAPSSGLVIGQVELKARLTDYAQKLGLLGREVDDFVIFWEKSLPPAPYYLVSHFSQKEANQIISFDINPRPNTFIKVVMYFKPLDGPISIEPPTFTPPPKREGFVVVDWSGLTDY